MNRSDLICLLTCWLVTFCIGCGREASPPSQSNGPSSVNASKGEFDESRAKTGRTAGESTSKEESFGGEKKSRVPRPADLANSTAASDHELIQGTWRMVFLNDANRRFLLPEDANWFRSTWKFGKTKIVQTGPRNRTMEQSFKIDSDHDPGWIDVGQSRGLYKLEGNLLRIILDETRRRTRPTDFLPDLGSENLFVLELIEPAFDGARPPKRPDREDDPIGKAWKIITFDDFRPQSVAWLGDLQLAVAGLIIPQKATRLTPRNLSTSREKPSIRLSSQVIRPTSYTPAIILVDIESGIELRRVQLGDASSKPPPAGNFMMVAAAPDNKRLAVADGRRVSLWSLSVERRLTQTALLETGELWSLSFSQDGRQLLTGSRSPLGTGIWNVDSGESIHKLKIIGGAAAIFVGNNGLVATAEQNNRVHLWDVKSGKQLAEVHAMMGILNSVAVSADGKTLFAAGVGGMKLWSLKGEGETKRLTGEKRWKGAGGAIRRVEFSSDGQYLVANSSYPFQLVILWDVSTGERLADIRQSSWPALSPNGRFLATLTTTYATYEDPKIRKQLRLWELKTLIDASSLLVGSPKYADHKTLLNDLADIVDQAVTALKEVKTADDAKRVRDEKLDALGRRLNVLNAMARGSNSTLPVDQRATLLEIKKRITTNWATLAGEFSRVEAILGAAEHLLLFRRLTEWTYRSVGNATYDDAEFKTLLNDLADIVDQAMTALKEVKTADDAKRIRGEKLDALSRRFDELMVKGSLNGPPRGGHSREVDQLNKRSATNWESLAGELSRVAAILGATEHLKGLSLINHLLDRIE